MHYNKLRAAFNTERNILKLRSTCLFNKLETDYVGGAEKSDKKLILPCTTATFPSGCLRLWLVLSPLRAM